MNNSSLTSQCIIALILLFPTKSVLPQDISGVWNCKLMGRFPYELHLTQGSDSTTWEGTSYFYHLNQLYGVNLEPSNKTVIQAKVVAIKKNGKYFVEETELINGPKNILGYNKHRFNLEFEQNKKGVKKLNGKDLSYVAIEPGSEYLGNVKFTQTSATLSDAQVSNIQNIEKPIIQLQINSFKSSSGNDSLSYLGNGVISFTVINKGTNQTPKLKFGISINSYAPISIVQSELQNNGIMPGAVFNGKIYIESKGQISDETIPVYIQVFDDETNEAYTDRELFNIPVKSTDSLTISIVEKTKSTNVKLAEKHASSLSERDKKYFEKSKNHPAMKTTESGLQYEVFLNGTGKKPTLEDMVSITYDSKTLDGMPAGSSNGIPKTLKVSDVANGLSEALQLMPEGSLWTVYIPAYLSGFPNKPYNPSMPSVITTIQLYKVIPNK